MVKMEVLPWSNDHFASTISNGPYPPNFTYNIWQMLFNWIKERSANQISMPTLYAQMCLLIMCTLKTVFCMVYMG